MAALQHHIIPAMMRIKAKKIRNTRVTTQSDSKVSTSKLSLIHLKWFIQALEHLLSASSFDNFIQILLEANDYTDMQV